MDCDSCALRMDNFKDGWCSKFYFRQRGNCQFFVPTNGHCKMDLSIVPSYKCNLHCSFCMYACGPDRDKWLDRDQLRKFLLTVNWDMVNSVGFYGGEVTLWLDECQRYIDMVPGFMPKFCISNGAWSREHDWTMRVIDFCYRNKIWMKVSCTPEHKAFQNERVLQMIEIETHGNIRVKERDDTKSRMNPMGRLAKKHWECTKKCLRMTGTNARRYAVEPNGDIMFQSCDGVFPVVSNFTRPWCEIERFCERLER